MPDCGWLFSPEAQSYLCTAPKLCDKRAEISRMDEEPHIEQATLEDLPQLTDLLFDLFSQEADFVPDRSKQMRGLRLILEQPNRGRIFVLRQNGTILGMINLLFTISTAEGGFVILLEDVIVHRDHRGQKFGDKLLSHAIAYAKKKDFVRITLLTDRMNADGQRFFMAHGFTVSNMLPMRLILNIAPVA
jgi:GNAT superfamily N-acetyltransferase